MCGSDYVHISRLCHHFCICHLTFLESEHSTNDAKLSVLGVWDMIQQKSSQNTIMSRKKKHEIISYK